MSQINFNKQIVSCLSSKNNDSLSLLKKFYERLVESINIVANIGSSLSGDMPAYKTLTIEALLTLEVHSRDVLTTLIDANISKVEDFDWSKHLRYEWDDHSNVCTVMQSDAHINYGYEYLGCSPRLVITPLTDRCYLTLTGALKMNLGGAPAGPAGTGKTESVKDLAKAMGVLCVVTNCGEGMDFKAIGKNLNGLCQSGAWGCFDEFNRIDASVLSVISSQLKTIQQALIAKIKKFMVNLRNSKILSNIQ